MTSVVDTARETARKNPPLENAKTLRGIYNEYKENGKTDKDKIDNYRFPAWVLEADRWTEGGDKSHKFDETIVVYDNDDDIKKVKELVEEREPVNIGMNLDEERYSKDNLKKNFGWRVGAYGKSTRSELYPNIGIYCHARVTNGVNSPEEKDVHVMNLIGYGFDSEEQPDYRYFLDKYKMTTADITYVMYTNDENMKKQFKEDLIQRYRKIWLKACYICKFKELKNLWYYGVGNNNFSAFLPLDWALSINFYNQIFAEAFGIDPTNSNNPHSTNSNENDITIPINFCKEYKINVLNLGTSSNKHIPHVLFTTDTTPVDTLYINAWDPWSIIGNGNAGDISLDGHWGRNSNMSVLGWSMTNSRLLPDIMGGASAETSKILSMKQILDKIKEKEKDAGSSASPPVSGDSPSAPSCNIDTSGKNITGITTECQDAIFSLVPEVSGKENILKKHLSVLRTDTEKATNDDLPPGSATIVDLSYYRKEFKYPDDRIKLGHQYIKQTKDDGKTETIISDVNSFNKEIQFVIQAAPAGFGAANISNQSVTNSVYNCLYLADKRGVQGIAFPIIGGDLFFTKLNIKKNRLYEILFQGVADYFNDFKESKIEVVLFAGSKRVDDNDDFEKTFNDFIDKNKIVEGKLKQIQTGIFNAYYTYNNNSKNKTKITALVNAANTYITFNNVSGLALAFKNMLGGVGEKQITTLYTLHDTQTGIDDKVYTITDDITKQGEKIKTAFKTAVDEYIKKPTAASPSTPKPAPAPASAPPATPPVVKKQFADVIKELEGKLTQDSENDAEKQKLKITLPDLSYPPNGDPSVAKKNLNSAEPAIGDMIKEFETAADGDDTKFYLGACRSIQAAYDLEMKGISDNTTREAMRAKLLLNLRKNSLLLKVPTRWDYATMQPGKEPELTEEEVREKYAKLQQECATLVSYSTEDAYKLAEQLIPLDVKMEIYKLEEKNKIVQKDYPTTERTYAPSIDITPGYTKIVTQESSNCGRAALANFFGVPDLLVKGDPLNTDEVFNLNNPRSDSKINMGSICNLRAKYAKLFKTYDKLSDECPDGENYSINVLNVVLQILGYTTGENNDSGISIIFTNRSDSQESKNNYTEANRTAHDENTLGYLVNLNKAHWICYKKSNLNSTDDSFYRINSMKETDEASVGKTTQKIHKLIEKDYSGSSGATNQYLSLHPITKLTDPTTNQKLFNLFTSSNGKDYYKELIESSSLDYNWKLFIKNVISKIIEKADKTDKEKLKIMLYLSNLTGDIIDKSLKQKILDLHNEIKSKIVDTFVENTKKNITSININEITTPKAYIEHSDGIFTLTISAKDRFFYNLNNTNTYDNNLVSSILTSINYKNILMPQLKGEIDLVLKSDSHSSTGGGGFKPRHNATINHAKSKHNSSFKVSSSTTKHKTHNRSHTQRVK